MLKNWLIKRWYYDNHKKYHKYFEEWYNNLLPSQLMGFEHQMYNDLNNVLR